MSVGPLPPAGNFTGAPLAQRASSDGTSRKEGADQSRADKLDLRAAEAEGIGRTEEDSETDDRDADGRRAWERKQARAESGDDRDTEDVAGDSSEPRAADPDGVRGNHLDLSI